MNFTLTTYPSRKIPAGRVEDWTWEDLKEKLKHPVFTMDSVGDVLTNEERTDYKDVGGFVGGKMKDGKRSKAALEYRTLLTVDADHATPHTIDDFLLLNDLVFCCHTTHSSTKKNPRLRWVFPLLRPVTAEEYPIIAAEITKWVGEDTIDETTDQPERLMFWPSCALDGDFQFWEGGVRVLDPDEILGETGPLEPAPAPPTEEKLDLGAQTIPEGQRNKRVFSYAATLRGAGLDYQGIRFALSDYNERYCEPALPEEELDTICRSVCSRYKPGDPVMATLRDAWDDFNDLGEWKEPEPKKIQHIVGESLVSLGKRYVAPPKFIIPGIIPYGITILASPPKFGKSWMCMDMAISVATGTEFMGLETNKYGVVYLALEDGDYRLRDRGLKVAGDRELPENLILVKEAPLLAEGLLPKIKKLVDETDHPVGMIIIDTLQIIRGVAGKTEGVYGYDYRELGQLHQFAIDNNLAVVLVHHLNKRGDDSDFVSRLNGSTGVSGAADTIIALTRASRESDETKMSITGRDVQERTLIIQMDWSNYRWILLGEERDIVKDREEIAFQSDPIVQTIQWHLDEAEAVSGEDEAVWSCTPQELADEIKRLYESTYNSLVSLGVRLKQLAPQLEKRAGVKFQNKKVGNDRKYTFSRKSK